MLNLKLKETLETEPKIPVLAVLMPERLWPHLPKDYQRHLLTSDQVQDLMNEAHSMNSDADDLVAKIEQSDLPLQSKMSMLSKVENMRGRADRIFNALFKALGLPPLNKAKPDKPN